MKKINFKYLSLAALLIVGAGCNDFLQQPTPGKSSAAEFYKTDTDAVLAVNAVYDRLSSHYYTAWGSMYMVKMMLSDESNAGGSNDGDQVGYQTLDDYKTDSQNDKISLVWGQLYSVIQRANAIIDNTAQTSDLQKRVVAEAKALRAYAYFDLVNLWGKVPLVIHPPLESQYVGYPQSEKTEVYAQIEKDLTEAIAVLPAKSVYAAVDKFRVSKGTAQVLLGKVLMYESASTANGGLGVNKWADAATQLKTVINSTEYSLETAVGKTMSKSGEFGKESVFELSFSDYAYNWGNFPWGGNPESNIHIQLMGPRADYFVAAPGDSLIGGWGFNTARSLVYDQMEAGDGRKGATIMSLAEFQAEGGQWTSDSWKFAGYFQRRISSFSNQTNGAPPNTPELNYGTNFRLIRYSDVLLLAAEAAHNSGDDATAVGYVNQVRTRKGTGLAAISVTGAALMDAIVHERLIELAFEGHRFQDLVRWGLATTYLGPLGYQADKHNLLPIPYAEILSASLKQNNKY